MVKAIGLQFCPGSVKYLVLASIYFLYSLLNIKLNYLLYTYFKSNG